MSIVPDERIGELLTRTDAAKLLGISTSSIRRLTLTDKTFPKPRVMLKRRMYQREALLLWAGKPVK